MTQRATMTWQGGRLWTRRGRRLASEGLQQALEHTLGVANELVPLDEGPLMQSGKVTVDGLNGEISYSTPYAVIQHENMEYQHAPGRSAKYLEIPMNTEHDVMMQIMAVSIRDWLRG